MKKRKAPILLLSLMVVLIGGIVVMSLGGGSNQPPAPDQGPTADSHGTPSAQQVANDVKSNIKPKRAPMAISEPDRPGSGPSIAVRHVDTSLQKPKPNPSGSTDTGWYAR